MLEYEHHVVLAPRSTFCWTVTTWLGLTSDLKHPEVHFLEILNGNGWKSCTDGERFHHQFMSVDQTKSQYSLRGRRPVTVVVSNEVVAPKT